MNQDLDRLLNKKQAMKSYKSTTKTSLPSQVIEKNVSNNEKVITLLNKQLKSMDKRLEQIQKPNYRGELGIQIDNSRRNMESMKTEIRKLFHQNKKQGIHLANNGPALEIQKQLEFELNEINLFFKKNNQLKIKLADQERLLKIRNERAKPLTEDYQETLRNTEKIRDYQYNLKQQERIDILDRNIAIEKRKINNKKQQYEVFKLEQELKRKEALRDKIDQDLSEKQQQIDKSQAQLQDLLKDVQPNTIQQKQRMQFFLGHPARQKRDEELQTKILTNKSQEETLNLEK